MSDAAVYYRHLDLELTPLTLFAHNDALIRIEFSRSVTAAARQWLRKHCGVADLKSGEPVVIRKAAQQLANYQQGLRMSFEVPLKLHGTDYQKRLWNHLRTIPAGSLSTYGRIAGEIGSSARAVGNANGRNPIPIVIPCHRVIAGDGGLCGFAGGVNLKERLIRHEGAWHLVAERQSSLF